MKELPETIEVYHELVGRQIQDILQENRELKMKLEKQENQLRSIRIQYKSDIQALRDDASDLEAVNNEFKEIIQNIGVPPKNKTQKVRVFQDGRERLPMTPLTNKKRKLSEPNESISEDESPLSQTVKPSTQPISDVKYATNHPLQLPTQYSSDSTASIERPVYNKDNNGSPRLMYQGKPFDRDDFTDSQFDMLPTQYSSQDNENEIDLSKKLDNASQIVVKEENKENFDEIEDSQDEFPLDSFELIKKPPIKVKREPLENITSKFNSQSQSQLHPKVPSHYTKLQRRAYLKEYYESKFKHSPGFKIDLNSNPINEMEWIINDFKPNPNYVKSNQVKGNALSKNDQNNVDRFYQLAGPLPKVPQLTWNNEVIESDNDSIGLSESQVLDKYPSPPGFMVSEFPDTQEQHMRNRIIDERQEDRIKRRVKQCIRSSRNKNGEFIFQVDILNKFAQQNRFNYDY